ncbi:tRNA 2-thiouridine synthesizing protein E [Klebsiella pneumoniae]|uniref:Sulfurtransferase TusE n=1 Tax=Klebsiella pneumoniae TaxID=573 RepID=A0A2X3F089_KLEPN|nr:tRNA 2-thiouridine synthesizing protein E [Klebsiella pneumoniae]
MFIFEGNEIETDSEGYLKDTTQWSEAMAESHCRAGRDNARR